MSNKTSSSSTPTTASHNAKHVHYHLYQYQTQNSGCCTADLKDHQRSALTTAASSNVNDDDDESQSTSMNTPNTAHVEPPPSTTDNSNATQTPCDSRNCSTANENVIDVENTNENFHRDDDKCSCTRKYVPYKINEKNVWQVYETSDCKYIQSRYEINEVFEPSSSTSTASATATTTATSTKATEFTTTIAATDETAASTTPSMLYSRSNFSDRIIYQARNQDEKRESSTENCTPFADDNGKLASTSSDALHHHRNKSDNNVKSEAYNIDDDQHGPQQRRRSCKCVVIVDAKGCENGDEYDDDSARASTSLSSSTVQHQRVMTSKYDAKSPTVHSNAYRQSGKLLNRPKATNNIASRDQVKPVEREIQNAITHENGSVKMTTTAMKALKSASMQKPICLPSATTAPKLSSSSAAQAFDDDCGSSASSVSDETVKENQKGKMNYENEKQQSLMRQENKVAIPNIHQQQGWSVTVSVDLCAHV